MDMSGLNVAQRTRTVYHTRTRPDTRRQRGHRRALPSPARAVRLRSVMVVDDMVVMRPYAMMVLDDVHMGRLPRGRMYV